MRMLFLWGALCLLTAAEPELRLPSEWLSQQETVWRDNGVSCQWQMPDVLEVQWDGQRQWYLRLPDEAPLSREAWRKAAYAGSSFPEARLPMTRLLRGAMVYEGRVKELARQTEQELPAALDTVLGELRSLGLNSIVYCTYMTPGEWPEVERLAEKHDIDLIVQYNAAYFLPQRGRNYYHVNSLPKALSFLEVAHGSPRLLGFSVKEEIYVPELTWMQEYHKALKRHYPQVPLYTLYNSTPALAATREPASEIVGTDIYPFLGGYYGGGRQLPSFLPPQRALRHQLLRTLRDRRDEAMRRGSEFTYTPDMQPGSWVLSDEEMRERNIPRIDYSGVIPLTNGRWLLWRRYRAPANALKASIWLSAACGAKGWFPWYYSSTLPHPSPIPESPEAPFSVDSSHTGGSNSPIWQEYAQALVEVGRYEPWLLNLRADGFPRFMTEDELLIGETHRLTVGSGHVVILVNLDVGRWADYPRLDMKAQNLDVSFHGELTGYEPLDTPRHVVFRLRMAADEVVRRLDTGEPLPGESTENGGEQVFRVELGPGSGLPLYIGTDEAWEETITQQEAMK